MEDEGGPSDRREVQKASRSYELLESSASDDDSEHEKRKKGRRREGGGEMNLKKEGDLANMVRESPTFGLGPMLMVDLPRIITSTLMETGII